MKRSTNTTKTKAQSGSKGGELRIEGRLSISRLSTITGLDRRTIDRICVHLPGDESGRVEFIPAVRAILAHFREDVEGKRELLELQRQSERRRVTILDMELREKAGQLVPKMFGYRIFKELLELTRQWAKRQPPAVRQSFNEALRKADAEGMAARAVEVYR